MEYEARWFERRAFLTPDRIALIDADRNRSTYRELYHKSLRIASFLAKQGISKGDRIAILTWNEISYFELLFAANMIGAIFLPLNFRLSEKEISFILRDAKTSLLFYHPHFYEMSVKLKKEGIQIPMFPLPFDWVSRDAEDSFVPVRLSGNDPWVMLYTGGTTGKPKGVVLSYHNILWNAINTVVSWSLSDREITYTVMPLFHTGGLNALTIPILYAGGKVILGRQFNPEEAIRIVEEEKVTILLLVPTMHQMVLQHPALDQADFTHSPIFLSGGAPCPLTIYEGYQKRGIRFKEGYGLTEAGPNNFYLTPDEALMKKGSVGKPMIHNRIYIVNDDGKEVPPGEVGELVIEGPHVFSYYWNNEEETKKAVRGSRLYTGDLAKRDEEGYYYIVGRKKEMFISGGENIYPLEIETVLNNHPQITEVVVIGVPDDRWGEIGVAFLVGNNGVQLTKEELSAYCETYLARYKIPKRFIYLNELPKTAVGKIDRKALFEQYLILKNEENQGYTTA